MSEGKWIVHTKGGPGRPDYEICVIRENNDHGIRSYGWFYEDKKQISTSGGPCYNKIDQFLWDHLIRVAELYAEELNNKEK